MNLNLYIWRQKADEPTPTHMRGVSDKKSESPCAKLERRERETNAKAAGECGMPLCAAESASTSHT